MKRSIFLFSAFIMITGSAMAQQKAAKQTVAQTKSQVASKVAPAKQAAQTMATKPTAVTTQQVVPQAQPAPAPAELNPDLSMKFNTEKHDFGTVPEGPSVSYEYEFKNIGKQPIILNNVHASCGCTTPSWTKEPVLPGQTGKVTATYNTQGRPGPVTKTVTVGSNVGTKVISFSVNVEKAPETSVPANNNSMIKH